MGCAISGENHTASHPISKIWTVPSRAKTIQLDIPSQNPKYGLCHLGRKRYSLTSHLKIQNMGCAISGENHTASHPISKSKMWAVPSRVKTIQLHISKSKIWTVPSRAKTVQLDIPSQNPKYGLCHLGRKPYSLTSHLKIQNMDCTISGENHTASHPISKSKIWAVPSRAKTIQLDIPSQNPKYGLYHLGRKPYSLTSHLKIQNMGCAISGENDTASHPISKRWTVPSRAKTIQLDIPSQNPKYWLCHLGRKPYSLTSHLKIQNMGCAISGENHTASHPISKIWTVPSRAKTIQLHIPSQNPKYGLYHLGRKPYSLTSHIQNMDCTISGENHTA